VAEKLTKEVAGIRFESPEKVMALPYVHQIFSETMRLYPAAWSVGRELTEDLEWENYSFPKGSSLMLSQYHTHRNSKHWDKPEEFRPERFSPEEEKKRHPFAYFPFGGGQRTCIGSNLARLEAQVILPLLWQRYEMKPVQGHTYRIRPLISLVLDPGVKLILSRRKD
jgi:cytochrome P450